MTLRPFVVLGAGGHGRELAALAKRANPNRPFLGFLDDNQDPGEHQFGHVLGPLTLLAELESDFIAGVGDPAIRLAIAKQAGLVADALSLVDPSAQIGERCSLGTGSALGPGCVLTVDVEVGSHSHLHSNVSLAHDVSIGSFVTATPGATVSGGVQIADRCWLGVGSTINQGISVGEGSIVGAGAVVISDVEAGTTVVGVPARAIERTAR